MFTRFKFFTVIALLLSDLLFISGCRRQEKEQPFPAKIDRIISLAPDITETVYALGLGDKLVGATTYCLYPEAAKEIPRVGGFGQFNFEAMVSLKPDVVILHWKYDEEKSRLDGLGIPYLETNTDSMTDIIESIEHIGTVCGAGEKANDLLSKINDRLSTLPGRPDHPPRVLVTFGGDSTSIDQIYAFGSDCLHNTLLELAGGKNVVESKLSFSTLSKEAVIRLNPDIIIQLTPGVEIPSDPAAAWHSLAQINAVKNNRIHVLNGDYTCIPGPRFIQILDDFKRIIWQNNFVAE